MEKSQFCARWIPTLIIGAVALSTGAAISAEQSWMPPTIQQNALLSRIYTQDPQKAVRLAIEAERTLALATPEGRGNKSAQPRTRGDRMSPDRGGSRGIGINGDITGENRKALEQNPVLREIYFRSPLAALRMLKRLREAAGKK